MKFLQTKYEIWVIFGLISLYLFIVPLFSLQISIFNKIVLSSFHFKAIFSFLLLILLSIKMRKDTIPHDFKKYNFLFYIFILFNAYIICLNSSIESGFKKSLLAFAYNYSLTIFIYPYFILSQNSKPLIHITCAHKIIMGLSLLLTSWGLYQFIIEGYIFPDSHITYLYQNDIIKVDHLDTYIRATSFLKSPLEFGIFSTLIALIALWHLLYREEKIYWYSIIFLLSGLSVFLTLSRTCFLMFLVGTAYLCYIKMKNLINFIKPIAIGLIVSIPLVFYFSKIFSTAINPQNLYLRIESWITIIKNITVDNLHLIMGKGIVQNGKYGFYHTAMLDNTYLGTIATGGILGLVLFLFVWFSVLLILKERKKRHQSDQTDILIAFFLAFSAGMLFENMMHILYYPLLFSCALSIVEISKKKN
ncbi:MAG: hypothetical protein KBD63_01000 [Bacteriovoracaceae bacterium]|nr:hypothetical protein [Bacteriovoracaceae bacterium]